MTAGGDRAAKKGSVMEALTLLIVERNTKFSSSILASETRTIG